MIGPFERLTPWLRRTQAPLQTGRGFALALAGYILVAFALRAALFAPASQDDAEQLIFAQSLAGGYNPAQPPLYTWLVVGAGAILGPGLPAVLVVKFACLAALYGFLFLAAREMLGDATRAALAAMGLWGLHYVAYDALFNYANTLPHAAACAATLWALARLRRAGALADFALLGLCLGLGLLAKYAYALFAASLLAAALTVPGYRRALLRPGLALALAVALALLAPHLLWVVETVGDLVATFRARLEEPGQGYWGNLDKGLFKLVNGPLYFLLPLWAFALVAFPRAWRPLRLAAPDPGHEHRRLLERFFLVTFAALAVAVFALGVPNIRTHYMFVFVGFPIWILSRAAASGQDDERRRAWFGAALTATAAAFLAVMVGRFLLDPHLYTRAYFHLPYPALAEQIRAAGFRQGTILAAVDTVDIAGNLKARFPDSTVASTKYAFYLPPPRAAAGGQCLLVWEARARAPLPAALAEFARARFGVTPPADIQPRYVEAAIARAPMRRFGLGFVMIDGAGRCR